MFILQLEWKDTLGSPGHLGLQVEIAGQSESLAQGKKATLNLPELSLQSKITIGLNPTNPTVLPLRSLFAGKLQGKVDKWVQLDEGVKVRVFISLVNGSKKKKRPSKKGLQCPYLEALASNNEPEEFKYLLETRKPTGNTVRISIESPLSGAQEDIPADLKEIAQMQGSQLIRVVSKLCEEAASLNSIAQQLPAMRERLRSNLALREQVDQSAESLSETLRGQCAVKDERVRLVQEGRKQLGLTLKQEKEKLRQAGLDLDDLRVQLSDLNRANTHANVVSLLKKALDESIAVKKSTEKHVQDDSQALKTQQNQNEGEIEDLRANLGAIVSSLQTTQGNLDEVSARIKRQKATEWELQSKVSASSLAQDCSAAQSLFKENCAQESKVLEALGQFAEQVQQLDQEKLKKLESQLSDKKAQATQLGLSQDSQTELAQVVNELRRRLLDAAGQKITLEQTCCVRGDMAQILEQLRGLQRTRQQVRGSIQAGLYLGTQVLQQEGETIYKECSQLGTMLDLAQRAEDDLASLKDAMGELRKRNPPYVPVSGDPIDEALGATINALKDPLQVAFVREDAGRYQFGSRKVNVKLENGRLLFRSANTYVGFEEFLSVHAQKEVDKGELGAFLAKLAPAKKAAVGKAFLGLGKGKAKK